MSTERPDPVFEEMWHAQLFAVTVHLNELGHFTWPDWAAHFGEILKSHGLVGTLNGGNDYFLAWLDALESFLSQQGFTEVDDLRALKLAWKEAYVSTPHGNPVSLN